MIPAMWVPCPNPSTFAGAPPTKSTLARIREAGTAGPGLMPESTRATVTPRPVTPICWTIRSAPTVGTATSMLPTTLRSGETRRTRESEAIASTSETRSVAANAPMPASRRWTLPPLRTRSASSGSPNPAPYVTMTRAVDDGSSSLRSRASFEAGAAAEAAVPITDAMTPRTICFLTDQFLSIFSSPSWLSGPRRSSPSRDRRRASAGPGLWRTMRRRP